MVSLASEPWLSEVNRAGLEWLFGILPQTWFRISLAEFLVYNPLGSTWMFAAVFFLFWRIEDEHSMERRARLLEIVLACAVAVIATVPFRPWVAWPSPVRSASFQPFYDRGLWGSGSNNCFPSHSTLLYLIVALGILRLSRRAGTVLVVLTFFSISLPRIYLGGHYPIDVLASVVLALFSVLLVGWWCRQPRMRGTLKWVATRGLVTEAVIFLWLFELAEGFRSGADILSLLHKAA